MQNSRIYPKWEDIENLKDPLTEGELYFAKYLDDHLPNEWEIYIQPYLNGDRPDVVILHPKVGLMVFEVKDWNLKIYSTEEKEFYNKKTNQKGIYYKSYVLDKNHQKQFIPNPIRQIERYRSNLLLYIPRLANAIDDNFKRIAVLKIGLYFHNSTTREAQNFIPNFKEKHCLVFGRDIITSENIDKIVPDINRSQSYFMDNEWANEIRFWLKPPYHAIEQGQKIILSKEQKRHITPSPNQHQRLRGVAGSGKTLVIAQRAANSASQGKKILILTYNITLWHYIRDAISRARYGFEWEQIEFNHFHGFCKNYLYENDIDFPENDNDTNTFLDNTIPQLIIDSMKKGKNKKNRKYDVILIDEGQDYTDKYYHMLCMFLTDNNELLLVADEKQNIYSRELSWLENMKGTKFKGRWRELKESYRLPLPILKEANRFADMFLPDIGLIPEAVDNSLFDPKLLWREVSNFNIALEKIFIAFQWLTHKQSIHPSEIVILIPTHEEGLKFKKYFQDRNINVNDVFEEERGNKKHKHSFWMGDSRVKMSTIHSFKGWELLNVILLTPDNEEYPNIDYLMYIAITRTRENLIVFNRLKKYKGYGQHWLNKW